MNLIKKIHEYQTVILTVEKFPLKKAHKKLKVDLTIAETLLISL